MSPPQDIGDQALLGASVSAQEYEWIPSLSGTSSVAGLATDNPAVALWRSTMTSGNIVADDYFTFKCLETSSGDRDIVFRTYPTCTGDCQFTNFVFTANYSIGPVDSTWTYE